MYAIFSCCYAYLYLGHFLDVNNILIWIVYEIWTNFNFNFFFHVWKLFEIWTDFVMWTVFFSKCELFFKITKVKTKKDNREKKCRQKFVYWTGPATNARGRPPRNRRKERRKSEPPNSAKPYTPPVAAPGRRAAYPSEWWAWPRLSSRVSLFSFPVAVFRFFLFFGSLFYVSASSFIFYLFTSLCI
jgi:hypothetical protein